jgi:hypothetical protein
VIVRNSRVSPESITGYGDVNGREGLRAPAGVRVVPAGTVVSVGYVNSVGALFGLAFVPRMKASLHMRPIINTEQPSGRLERAQTCQRGTASQVHLRLASRRPVGQ